MIESIIVVGYTLILITVIIGMAVVSAFKEYFDNDDTGKCSNCNEDLVIDSELEGNLCTMCQHYEGEL